jgi:glycosyltransferase involved in cell wall biosynthesis
VTALLQRLFAIEQSGWEAEMSIAKLDVPASSEMPDYGLPQDAVDISFFIPCYNEELNVLGAVEKLVCVAGKLNLSYEILVFDDCSRDGTVKAVHAYQAAHPLIPIRLFANTVNRGVARNFFEGAFRARGRYYRLVCGDDIEPIESHEQLLRRIGEADIIVPYFTIIKGRPVHRHVISRIYTWLVNRATGYRLRYYNGCPIYRRFDVLRFHVEATGFGYQAEFLTRLIHENRSFVEVPLASIDRAGSGSLNLRDGLSVAHSLFKIALRRMRVYLYD